MGVVALLDCLIKETQAPARAQEGGEPCEEIMNQAQRAKGNLYLYGEDTQS
jgi:hypothetical protein